jgi:hypothetical protein
VHAKEVLRVESREVDAMRFALRVCESLV